MSEAQIAATPRLARREQILSTLQTIAQDVSGIAPADIDTSTTFLAMGVNSLLLIQFSQAMQDRLGVEIPFRRLFEDLSTLDALSAYLERELPPDAFPAETPPLAPAPTIPQPQSPLQPSVVTPPEAPGSQAWNGAEQRLLPSTALERIMAQQLQVMSQQLEVLRSSLW